MKTLTKIQKFTLEQKAFQLADKYIPDYTGGRWSWTESLQVFSPPADKEGMVSLINPDNYTDIKVPAEWAGMCICSIAYNQLSWKASERGDDAGVSLWLENQETIANLAHEAYTSDPECNAAKFFRFID